MAAASGGGRDVCFKVAYYTVWGQHLAVSGPSDALGGGDAFKALSLSCSHEGDQLVWQGTLTLPPSESQVSPSSHGDCMTLQILRLEPHDQPAAAATTMDTQVTYTYLVLNDHGKVEDAERAPRTLVLPGQLQRGSCVLVSDQWQVLVQVAGASSPAVS